MVAVFAGGTDLVEIISAEGTSFEEFGHTVAEGPWFPTGGTVVVGAPGTDHYSSNEGSIVLIDAGSYDTLFVVDGQEPDGLFGFAVSTGSDGILVGAPKGIDSWGAIHYLDFGGNRIWSLGGSEAEQYLGWSMDGSADINSDGHYDFAIGAPGSGQVYLINDISESWELIETPDGKRQKLGTSVLIVNDMNGDGHKEIAAGTGSPGQLTVVRINEWAQGRRSSSSSKKKNLLKAYSKSIPTVKCSSKTKKCKYLITYKLTIPKGASSVLKLEYYVKYFTSKKP